MAQDVDKVWTSIEQYYSARSPQILQELGPPAHDEQIAALESEIGFPIPDDVRCSLKRHNGQCTVNGFDDLDVEGILRVWRRMNERNQRGDFSNLEPADASGDFFAPNWWNPRWLPVAEHRAGTLVCSDTAPRTRGAMGQILILETSEEGPCLSESRSFADWLEKYSKDLAENKYEIDQYNNINRI